MLTPEAMIEDAAADTAELLEPAFRKATRKPRVQVVCEVLWYRGNKTDPIMIVLSQPGDIAALMVTTTDSVGAMSKLAGQDFVLVGGVGDVSFPLMFNRELDALDPTATKFSARRGPAARPLSPRRSSTHEVHQVL